MRRTIVTAAVSLALLASAGCAASNEANEANDKTAASPAAARPEALTEARPEVTTLASGLSVRTDSAELVTAIHATGDITDALSAASIPSEYHLAKTLDADGRSLYLFGTDQYESSRTDPARLPGPVVVVSLAPNASMDDLLSGKGAGEASPGAPRTAHTDAGDERSEIAYIPISESSTIVIAGTNATRADVERFAAAILP